MPRKKIVKLYSLQEIDEYLTLNGLDMNFFQAFSFEEMEDGQLRTEFYKVREALENVARIMKEKTGHEFTY